MTHNSQLINELGPGVHNSVYVLLKVISKTVIFMTIRNKHISFQVALSYHDEHCSSGFKHITFGQSRSLHSCCSPT